MPDPRLLDEALIVRRLRLAQSEIVYVKSIVQASEGLCGLLAERSDSLITLVAPRDREAELDRLVDDLVSEVGARVEA